MNNVIFSTNTGNVLATTTGGTVSLNPATVTLAGQQVLQSTAGTGLAGLPQTVMITTQQPGLAPGAQATVVAQKVVQLDRSQIEQGVATVVPTTQGGITTVHKVSHTFAG